MLVYFLRHGKAIARAAWEGDDGLRPLTEGGEASIVRESRAMTRFDPQPDVVVTSPLLRARRTAEIVAATLGMRTRLVEDVRLAHGFNARRLAAILAGHSPDAAVMVVGHEPELSAAVAELVGGGRIVLEKGGLACVHVPGPSLDGGELEWLLTPPQLEAM